MTEFHEIIQSRDSVQCSWKAPEYLPKEFKLTVECKYDSEDHNLYSLNTILPPNQTSFILTSLPAVINCEFTLIAVYNPASIDPGITTSTRPTGKC